MGKIILEFDSEDAEDARVALDGHKWKGLVWDLDQELRKITKYGFVGNIEATTEEVDAAEKLREELRRLLEEWKLNLDD
jgi:hypothetical protein